MRRGIWLALPFLFAFQPTEAAKKEGDPQAVVELGRRLFFDPAASRAGKFACAECHKPEHGFSDPRRFSVDENGTTSRHSQTLIDLKDGSGFHWDGEFDYLDQLLTARVAPLPAVMKQTRELVKTHFLAAERRGDRPSEEAYNEKLRSLTPPYYGPDTPRTGPTRPFPQPLLARLSSDGRYDRAFRKAFGRSEPTTERIVESMRAYLLSIESGENRFDEYLDGKPDALTAAERRGLRLFEGKAGCAQCHVSRTDGNGFAKFTDYTYRNTGIAFHRLKVDFKKTVGMDMGFGGQTFASADIGSFKVPSLRDVARRAPYMHDGSLETLDAVVGYYEKGGTQNGRIDPKIHSFDLADDERADLVAFLHSLSSKTRPGLGEPMPWRAEEMHVKLVGYDGRPMKGLRVRVIPFGDRLKGASRRAEPKVVESDRRGKIRFPMPLWTHVKLEALGYEIGYDRPLPDIAGDDIELVVAPRRKIHVEVYAHEKGDTLPSVLEARAHGPSRKLGTIKLKRERFLGRGHALYVTDRIHGVDSVLVQVPVDGNTARLLREIDMRGGMSEPLDFR